ncbi:MAG: acyltransferase [Rhodospirillales bacterium]|nr:acyltransferase [Rhodospirillales bacterium]
MRILSLDLLRGGAAFMVAIPHFFVIQSDAYPFAEAISVIAVEIFFVLSGFVLAPQIFHCINNPKEFRIFVARRWIRTLPPYVAALVMISVIVGELQSTDFLQYLFFVQSITHITLDNDYFAVAWSLSIEEWFYIIFPIFLLTIRTWVNPGVKAILLFVAFFFILKMGYWLILGGDANDMRRAVMYRLDSIAFGVMTYLYTKKVSRGFSIIYIGFVLAVIGEAIIWRAIFSGEAELEKLLFLYISPIMAMSTIAILYRNENYFRKIWGISGISGYFGKISYSVYLFHLPIAYLINSHIGQNSSLPVFFTYIIALLCFCSAFYHLFEKPILATRPRYKARGYTGES